MSSKMAFSILIGVVAIIAALAALTMVPEIDMTRFKDSIQLATLVIGFFLTTIGTAVTIQVSADGIANKSVTASQLAFATVPAGAGALLVIAGSL